MVGLLHFSCAHSTIARRTRATKAPRKSSTRQPSPFSACLLVPVHNEALKMPHISSIPWQPLDAPHPAAATADAAARPAPSVPLPGPRPLLQPPPPPDRSHAQRARSTSCTSHTTFHTHHIPIPSPHHHPSAPAGLPLPARLTPASSFRLLPAGRQTAPPINRRPC